MVGGILLSTVRNWSLETDMKAELECHASVMSAMRNEKEELRARQQAV